MANLIIAGANAITVGGIISNSNFGSTTVDATGANLTVPGNLTIQTTANLGAVGNITITGGSNGQALTTNGSGVLTWTTPSGGGAPVIATPSITSPTAAQTGFSITGPITGSTFTVSSGVATHLSSDWQVATDSGFATIVASSSGNTSALTSWVPSGLSGSTSYYTRVRYNGTNPAFGTVPSSYSAGVNFTTGVPPGITWTYQAGLSATTWGVFNAATSTVWNGSQYLVVADSGAVATSPDGITWTYQAGLSATTFGTTIAFSAVWNGSQYLVVGSNGAAATSPDGITWTYRAGLSATTWGTTTARSAAWNGSQYLVVGDSGKAATSP
jgi:hypothetical protein